MTTTELIELLKKVEYGASGRPREISISIDEEYTHEDYISCPRITIDATGDGIAGSELTLKITN